MGRGRGSRRGPGTVVEEGRGASDKGCASVSLGPYGLNLGRGRDEVREGTEVESVPSTVQGRCTGSSGRYQTGVGRDWSTRVWEGTGFDKVGGAGRVSVGTVSDGVLETSTIRKRDLTRCGPIPCSYWW